MPTNPKLTVEKMQEEARLQYGRIVGLKESIDGITKIIEKNDTVA